MRIFLIHVCMHVIRILLMVWWYGWQVIALTFLGVLTCYVSALNLVLASIAYIAFEHMQVWTLHWMDSQTGMYIHLCN